MRTASIRDTRPHDSVGQRNRQHRRRRLLLWLSLVTLGFGGLVALLFFTPWFTIRDVAVSGASDGATRDVRTVIEEQLASRWLGLFAVGQHILFLSADGLVNHITERVPAVASAQVSRDYPHGLRVELTERVPQGIWCRQVPDRSADDLQCRYWDRSGVRWGSAVPSVGPLLVMVRDERSEDTQDARLAAGLIAALDGLPRLGLAPRMLTLPDLEPGGLRVTINGGPEVLLDALADVQGQLDTLELLLADRAGDAAFRPAYIDLRTQGRVYYR